MRENNKMLLKEKVCGKNIRRQSMREYAKRTLKKICMRQEYKENL